MYTLISDYDGTFKPFDKNPNIIEKYIFIHNIESTKNLIKNNNQFIIATGRDTKSIIDEIKKYNIDYNYLITYNGRVILDKNNNLLYANYINKECLQYIKNEIIIKKFLNFNEYGCTENDDNLIYSKINIKPTKEIKKLILKWQEKFNELSIDYNMILNILTIRNKFNKSLGIQELNNQISLNNIITVGDESNDFEMLKDYDGYRLFMSNPKLLLATKKSISSVHRLIKKLDKK